MTEKNSRLRLTTHQNLHSHYQKKKSLVIGESESAPLGEGGGGGGEGDSQPWKKTLLKASLLTGSIGPQEEENEKKKHETSR